MEEETDPRVNVNSPNEEDPSMEEEETDPRFQDKSPTKDLIPVAPYFRAEIPQYIGNNVSDPDTEKLLGKTIWPIENLNLGQNPDSDEDEIGNHSDENEEAQGDSESSGHDEEEYRSDEYHDDEGEGEDHDEEGEGASDSSGSGSSEKEGASDSSSSDDGYDLTENSDDDEDEAEEDGADNEPFLEWVDDNVIDLEGIPYTKSEVNLDDGTEYRNFRAGRPIRSERPVGQKVVVTIGSCPTDPSMEEEETDPRFQDKSPTKQVILVAPYFQAEIPQHIGNNVNDPETEKFLGNKIWPIENLNPDDQVGKGRPDACTCPDPKTRGCIRTHVAQEKARLRDELGAAFREWKFDEMGDDARLKWSDEEIETIEDIVAKVPAWKRKEFLKEALKALHPGKDRASIVKYLYNIVIPRKIWVKTKMMGKCARDVHTDDELVSNSNKRAAAALRGPEEKKRRQI